MMILVHQGYFTAANKTTTYCRVRAGQEVVDTEKSSSGQYQQAVSIRIEQGTETLDFELMYNSKVLAVLKMKVWEEILNKGETPESFTEKMFSMKSKDKNYLNPKIKLTFSPDNNDEEKALVANLGASDETAWMLQQHLSKVQKDTPEKGKGGAPAEEMSEIMLLAQGCSGPLTRFTFTGREDDVWVAIQGPPKRKKHALVFWDSEKEFNEGAEPSDTVDLLRMSAVYPDPGRPEIFAINYVNSSKKQDKVTLKRVDRSRDVWVELLQLLVTKVHEERREQKSKKK